MEDLKKIVEKIKNRKCILFLGAGISKNAGCKGWNRIIHTLKEQDWMKTILQENDIDFDAHWQNRNNVELLTFLTTFFQEEDWKAYFGHIQESLEPDSEKFKNKYIPLTAVLNYIAPFPPIVTTNVDYCLQKAKLIDYQKTYFRKGDFKLKLVKSKTSFHIHGFVSEIQKSIWIMKDYIKFYTNHQRRRFLKSIISNKSFVFMGSSLKDSDLLKIFHEVFDEGAGKEEHFAFVSCNHDNFNKHDISYYKRMFNIKILRYGDLDQFHSFVEDLVYEHFQHLSPKNGIKQKGVAKDDYLER